MGKPLATGQGMAAAANAAAKRSKAAQFQAIFEQELGNGLFESAIGAVKSALSATRTVRTRTEQGIAYKEVPDYAVQLAAGVTVMQYALGKPVNRTEMTVKNDGEQTPAERSAQAAAALLSDPETLMNVLGDWHDAAKDAMEKQKRAKPLEVSGG